MEFYSHPDKKLVVHLKEVRDLGMLQIKDELKKAYNIVSCCHDFGKYTTYFQTYLFSKDKEKSPLSNHGFISAVFAAYVALNEFPKESYIPYIIYNCVLHHHGSLENPSEDLPQGIREIKESDSIALLDKIEYCKEQIEDINKNREFIEKDYEDLGIRQYFNEFLDNSPVKETLLSIRKIDSRFQRRNNHEEPYFTHQNLYSALISSDKLSASNTVIPDINYVQFIELNSIKNEKFKSNNINEMNKIRSEIFENIQKELEESYKDNKLFSITSPTGTGKTYSGFFAALKVKDLLGGGRKIVYSLPFTSIIDQNYNALNELLEKIEGFKENSSTYMIKHHNLANVDYKWSKEEYDKDKAELLIENWSSGIVVTTFVQLLQTLIGNRNRMLKKFNSLEGAIILLDEIQAIDIKYYKLVDFILRSAVKYLDCRIIMMTATKPLVLQDSHELLKENEKYFAKFNRTKLIPKLDPITVEEFLFDFEEELENKSYLIISNTINQSLEIYESVKKLGRKVLYLSTNILPVHRRKRIKEINECLKVGEKIIVVSTQVVEAGVDFDFDVVIRDIAPMDSIIQAAGRCNRNSRKDISGEVYVYSMIKSKENPQYYASMVYGKTLINISKEILNSKIEIQENMYFEIIKDYFEKVNQNINQQASDGFIESIKKLYFTKASKQEYENYSLNKFSLIKNNPDYMDVYFIIDDKAEDVYKKYLYMLSEKNIKKRKEIYLQIKNTLRDYTLSLPAKFNGVFEKWSSNDNKIFLINMPKEGCDEFYNIETGFKRENDEREFMVF